MKKLFLLIISSYLMACTAVAGHQVSFVLSAGEQKNGFTHAMLEQTLTGKEFNEIAIDINKIENTHHHFFYIKYKLQCDGKNEITKIFSLFPVNQESKFAVPLITKDNKPLSRDYLKTCHSLLLLYGRDDNKAPEDIRIEGTIYYHLQHPQ